MYNKKHERTTCGIGNSHGDIYYHVDYYGDFYY